MKTLKTTLALILITVFTLSCSSDDDSANETTSQNESLIIGEWKYTSSTENGEPQMLFPCDLLNTLTFTKSTVTHKVYEDPSGEDGTNCQLIYNEPAPYSINNNTITVYGFSQEIVTLNSTTLVLKEMDEYDGNTYVYTETYTKQ